MVSTEFTQQHSTEEHPAMYWFFFRLFCCPTNKSNFQSTSWKIWSCIFFFILSFHFQKHKRKKRAQKDGAQTAWIQMSPDSFSFLEQSCGSENLYKYFLKHLCCLPSFILFVILLFKKVSQRYELQIKGFSDKLIYMKRIISLGNWMD